MVATDDSGRSDEIAVTANVINMDEQGRVQVSSGQSLVGSPVSASLVDLDGDVTNESWQWQRCDTRSSSPCGAISGATSSSYTPEADDSGKYLMATVSSDDGHGKGRSAEGFSTKIASEVSTLDSLSLSGITLNFQSAQYSYSVTAPSNLTTNTIAATPTASSGVRVSIRPSDSDTSVSGHQLALDGNSTSITVVVQTDDRSGFSVYSVTINQ